MLIAVFVIVSPNTGDSDKADRGREGEDRAPRARRTGKVPRTRSTYAVEEGDTLSGIAAKFDVSTKRLERLNPDIDPQTLNAGQELTIR